LEAVPDLVATPDPPDAAKVAAPIVVTREVLAYGSKASSDRSWTSTNKQRRAARLIAENLTRNRTAQARRDAVPNIMASMQEGMTGQAAE
jgi:hypothetical protein